MSEDYQLPIHVFDVTANTNITISGSDASVRIRCYGGNGIALFNSYGRGKFVD